MKTYKEIYQHLIYEWNEQLLNQEAQISKKFISDSTNFYIINEQIYCNNFLQQFQNYFVEKFKEILQNIKIDPTNNLLEIPFKLVAKKLSRQDFKDYKDFDIFLNFLIKNKGVIRLSICNDGCYYECPLDFYKEQIRLYSQHPKYTGISLETFNQINIGKVKQFYKQYLEKTLKNKITLNLQLKKLKQNLQDIYDWGRINIDFKYFLNQQYKDDLDTAISHEFQHLMDYLININYQQWNYCQNYSNVAHNDFSRDISNLLQDEQNFERINYFLDENEFKSLSNSYVEYLRKYFVKNTDILTKEHMKNFLAAFYQICNFKFKNYTFFNEDIKKYLLIINHLRDIKDIKDFFQITYQDAKFQKNQISKGNKWFLLIRKLNKELTNQLI